MVIQIGVVYVSHQLRIAICVALTLGLSGLAGLRCQQVGGQSLPLDFQTEWGF